MYERICKVDEIIAKDFKELADKIIQSGTITPEQLDVVYKTVKLMLKDSEFKRELQGGFETENSYRRGRNMNNGQYMSRDMGRSMTRMPSVRMSYGYDPHAYDMGYSGHSIKDRMIASLESMYDTAGNEHERQMIDSWISRIESGE